MFKEFKKFIMRGNMMDLAVGMIIGAAFNAIVTSLVNDIFMPILAWIVGKPDFSDLVVVLGGDGKTAATLAEAQELGLTTWNYGSFITAVINFLLMAFVVFLIVKGMNKLAEGGIGEGGGFGDMIGRGIRKILGRTGSDATSKFINSLAEPVEQALSANINDMLQNHSEEIVGQLLHTEMDDFLSRPMNKLLKGKDAEIERFVSSVLSLYKSTIKERLPRILEAVDIRKIVEDRINEMDMSEAEKIILDVISKELRAIVWLGAGLGFIMGFVNCLII